MVILSSTPAVAGAASHARSLDRMIVAMGAERARAAQLIRQLYRDHLDLLLLEAYVAPLPDNPGRFNVMPRLAGPHPIGEKE